MGRHRAVKMAAADMALEPQELRSRVANALEKASALMVRKMATHAVPEHGFEVEQDEDVRALQAHVAELGQWAAGLAFVDASCLPARGAGYGSRVRVQDMDTGDMAEYMLMVGSLVDIDADQVSLASPMGQALIGRVPGDIIRFVTPQREVRMRVIGLKTMVEALAERELVRSNGDLTIESARREWAR